MTRTLETRIQQVSRDAESVKEAKAQLENEKKGLQEKCERLHADVIDFQARYARTTIIFQRINLLRKSLSVAIAFRHTAAEKELARLRQELDQELRSMRNKNEAAMTFLKQEHNTHATKVRLHF